MPVSSSKRIFQLGELGWAQTSTDSGCVKDLGALSHTLGVWNCSTRVCPWPQLDLTVPGRIPRSLDCVGWVPTYRLKGFCASHLCLRLGSSLILEANLPLISVANIHQAGLAAAVATAKDSVLSCAVIRSLIKYSLNIPSSPFLKQGWSHSPFGRAVLCLVAWVIMAQQWQVKVMGSPSRAFPHSCEYFSASLIINRGLTSF